MDSAGAALVLRNQIVADGGSLKLVGVSQRPKKPLVFRIGLETGVCY